MLLNEYRRSATTRPLSTSAQDLVAEGLGSAARSRLGLSGYSRSVLRSNYRTPCSFHHASPEKLSTCRTQGVKAVFDRCGLQRCLMALPPLRYNSTKLPSYSAYKETCSDDSEPLTWFVPLGMPWAHWFCWHQPGNNLQSLV